MAGRRAARAEHRVALIGRVDRPVGIVRFQIVKLRAASGNGQNLGANGAAAADVQGRVADDQDFFAAQLLVQNPTASTMSNGRDLIPVFVVVGERARLELFPQIEMAQFYFSAETDVAGEQADYGRLWQCARVLEESPDAGACLRVAVRKNVIKPEDVALEEVSKVFRRGGDAVDAKKLAHQAFAPI